MCTGSYYGAIVAIASKDILDSSNGKKVGRLPTNVGPIPTSSTEVYAWLVKLEII